MDDFGECKFLTDMENESAKIQELSRANEKSFLKRSEVAYQKVVDLLLSSKAKRLGESANVVQRLKRERDVLDIKLTKVTEQVEVIHEECKVVRSLVDDKLNEVPEVAQELERRKELLVSTEHEMKNEQKSYSKNHKSCLLVKDTYKKIMGFHARLLKTDDEDGNQLIFTFESVPQFENNSSMPHKSVKLLRSTTGHWKMVTTNPTLPNFEQLSTRFEESQDLQGLLTHLGKVFKINKKSKANGLKMKPSI